MDLDPARTAAIGTTIDDSLAFALQRRSPVGERCKCFLFIAQLPEYRWVKAFLLFSRLEIWHSAASMPSIITQAAGNDARST